VSQLLLQYLFSDEEEEGKKSIFVMFVRTKNKQIGESKTEKKKEGKKEGAELTESCSTGAVRMSMLVTEDMIYYTGEKEMITCAL
jgi:hypothetical protein